MSLTANVLPNLDLNSLQADERRLIERITFEKTFDVSTLNLSSENQRIYDQNPHLREVFVNKRPLIISQESFAAENRLLSSVHNRLKDSSLTLASGQVHTVDHWGRRKLMMAEIEFLTEYGHEVRLHMFPVISCLTKSPKLSFNVLQVISRLTFFLHSLRRFITKG